MMQRIHNGSKIGSCSQFHVYIFTVFMLIFLYTCIPHSPVLLIYVLVVSFGKVELVQKSSSVRGKSQCSRRLQTTCSGHEVARVYKV